MRLVMVALACGLDLVFFPGGPCELLEFVELAMELRLAFLSWLVKFAFEAEHTISERRTFAKILS